MKKFLFVMVFAVLMAASAHAGNKPTEGKIVCTPDIPKVKMSLRTQPAPAPEEDKKSWLHLHKNGAFYVLTGELMTPSAGYSWSVEGVRVQRDKTFVTLDLHGLKEGMMGAMVLTPVKVSVPLTIRAQTKNVVVRLDKDFKWGAQSYTCPMSPVRVK